MQIVSCRSTAVFVLAAAVRSLSTSASWDPDATYASIFRNAAAPPDPSEQDDLGKMATIYDLSRPAGRRAVQEIKPTHGSENEGTLSSVSCSDVRDHGACGSLGGMCPHTCEEAGTHGQISKNTSTSTSRDETTISSSGTGFQIVSCAVLLGLPGGCSHDLSVRDSAIADGTRVGDVCPHECGGHAACAPSMLDLGFLGAAEDSSGAEVAVTLSGDACVDRAGVTFAGTGHVELGLAPVYASDAKFSIAFWVLKTPSAAWESRYEDGGDWKSVETIFNQPALPGRGHTGIQVQLRRGAWLDSWSLLVLLDGSGKRFQIELHRDSTPRWTHVAIVCDATHITAYADGGSMVGSLITTTEECVDNNERFSDDCRKQPSCAQQISWADKTDALSDCEEARDHGWCTGGPMNMGNAGQFATRHCPGSCRIDTKNCGDLSAIRQIVTGAKLGLAQVYCDETDWPDKNLICDEECTVLATQMGAKYNGRCDAYCASLGKQCVSAWNGDDGTCTPWNFGDCSVSFGTSSTAICKCSPDSSMPACNPSPLHPNACKITTSLLASRAY
jgi:hypothetical protein